MCCRVPESRLLCSGWCEVTRLKYRYQLQAQMRSLRDDVPVRLPTASRTMPKLPAPKTFPSSYLRGTPTCSIIAPRVLSMKVLSRMPVLSFGEWGSAHLREKRVNDAHAHCRYMQTAMHRQYDRKSARLLLVRLFNLG